MSSEPGSESSKPLAQASVVNGSVWMAATAEEAGQVYVTVDTSAHAFPEMPAPQIIVESDPLATTADQQVFKAMATLEPLTPAQPASTVGLNDLADLASAACARAPLLQRANGVIYPPVAGAVTLQVRQQQQQLSCGDCSAAFTDGENLFQHWIDYHCKPQGGCVVQADVQDKLMGMDLEQCQNCNLVFVKGSEKLKEHLTHCLILKAKEEESAAAISDANTAKVAKKASASASTNATSSMVSCGVCSVDVKTVTSFFLHWLEAHRQIMEVLQEVWQCGQCRPNRLFPTRDDAAAHVRGAHPPADSVYQCAERGCGARYATLKEAEAHQGRVHVNGGECGECREAVGGDRAAHFRRRHERLCAACDCQVEADRLDSHLMARHACENVWNRADSLSRITVSDTGENKANQSAKGTKRQQKLCISPEIPRKEPRLSDNEQPQQLSPQSRSGGGAGNAITGVAKVRVRCSACPLAFTSEKLLEKHYFANHEFQCKFCDAKMDKDVYGDHLRGHLATARKRTNSSSATATAASAAVRDNPV